MSERDVLLTHRFASFVDAIDHLPERVLKRAAQILTHNLMVALAARSLRIDGMPSEDWPHDLPRTASATRLSDSTLVPAEQAVFANSLLMGARAQHDEVPRPISHFGSTVIPALLATAEQVGGIDGRQLLTALVAGYEIGDRLGGALVSESTARGFRPTGIFGPIAAAASAAMARGLKGEAFISAVALAANMSAGLTETWRAGTDEWRVQTALAARSGYTAALLAEIGVTGSPATFEAPNGFQRAYSGTSATPVLTNDFGKRWAIDEVVLKLYPVCVFNQAAVQQTLELRTRAEGTITGITVHMNPSDADYPGVDAPDPPATRAASLMSLQVCTAIAALRGAVDIADLENPTMPDVRRLASRVEIKRDAAVPSHGARVVLRGTPDSLFDAGTPRGLLVDDRRLRETYAALAPHTKLSSSKLDDLFKMFAQLPYHGGVSDLIEKVRSG